MTLYQVLTTDPGNVGFAPLVAARNDAGAAALGNTRGAGNLTVSIPPPQPSAAAMLGLISHASLQKIRSQPPAANFASAVVAGNIPALLQLLALAHAAADITDLEYAALVGYLTTPAPTPATPFEAAGVTPYGVPVSVDAVSAALNRGS